MFQQSTSPEHRIRAERPVFAMAAYLVQIDHGSLLST
jgi:hypothetical protein